jgi:hypothetical protein
MVPVFPFAECEFTSTPGKFSIMNFFSLVAGPPYPHEPQYSISILLDILNNKC